MTDKRNNFPNSRFGKAKKTSNEDLKDMLTALTTKVNKIDDFISSTAKKCKKTNVMCQF